MKNQIMLVEYVSLWDDGVEIETTAKYNPVTGLVYDIETTDEDIEDLDILEREFVRLDDGSELDVVEESGKYKVIDFAEILKNLNGSNEPFVEGEQYPALEEVIIDYADNYDVCLNELDIEVLSSKMDVDEDGYPYIDNSIRIPKYKCEVLVSAYHHSGWDFYIEDFSIIEN